jgi:hypothetical protein
MLRSAGAFLGWGVVFALAGSGCERTDPTDPSRAGSDYELQGEFASQELGAQLVALGEGAFRVIFLPGGLPDGLRGTEERIEIDGRRQGGRVAFEGRYSAIAANGLLVGTTDAGTPFALERALRRSPTEGAPPPPRAIVLFGAQSQNGFDGRVERRGLLDRGATSRESFQSFQLHLEFRIPFLPSVRGQPRGNSGVFLQGRYQIQILDSFGFTGEEEPCGAIYGAREPDANASFPPLSWQTYDIDFEAARFDSAGGKLENARVSVRHNGVRIHDRVEIPGASRAGDPEGPEPGPIHLQGRADSPVYYRNIWLVPREGPREIR